jgi:predicted nuclease of predicted toxin-antitoxin system
MKIYLDDNSADALLVTLLRKAGHDVTTPADAGLVGSEDPVHLTHAIAEDRACLTKDHYDYLLLHNLIMQAQGHHPGILVVRQDNDPRRDLNQQGIVRATNNLLAAAIPTDDQYIILNHWR